jgi:HSP20 family protein
MALIKWNNGSSNGNSGLRNSSPDYVRRSLIDAFNYPFESVRMLQNLMDEDLGISGNNIGKTIPAVNISESPDSFAIEVAAPGMRKNDFSIEFHDNHLRIGYKKENNTTEGNDKNVLRREYSFESFERLFSLPETVNGENISATYENGILKIAVPKKEEAKKKPARNIEVR